MSQPFPTHPHAQIELTDEQFEELADRVAYRLERRFYEALGRWTAKRVLLLLGALGSAIGLWFWANTKGWFS